MAGKQARPGQIQHIAAHPAPARAHHLPAPAALRCREHRQIDDPRRIDRAIRPNRADEHSALRRQLLIQAADHEAFQHMTNGEGGKDQGRNRRQHRYAEQSPGERAGQQPHDRPAVTR
jgi:hypothetical protein